MTDWERCLDQQWYSFSDATPRRSESIPQSALPPLDTALEAAAPRFCELLETARVSEVRVDGAERHLYAWDARDGSVMAWVCAPPSAANAPVVPLHEGLLRRLGGIHELVGQPAGSWWLNHHGGLLTAEMAMSDATITLEVQHKYERIGLPFPIDVAACYLIAYENGRQTFVHRSTNEVILFAQDHSLSHVESFEGGPPLTLYRFRGAPDLASYLEAIADQWLAHIAS